MKMNKVGVILGIIVLVIAIIIYIITSAVANNKGNSTSQTSKPQQTTSETVKEDTDKVANDSTTTVNTTSKIEVETEPEIIEDVENVAVMLEINEDTLPAGVSKSEIGIIAKKAMVLVNEELYYSFTILLTDNTKVNYFANKDGYGLLSSGDKVNVDYTMYTNENNKVFYIIDRVTMID